ncbi:MULTISPECIES: hypothetical protein [Paraburkholderia]|uniref:Uncharacterized protein n=1 Tax=Paraburkholderia madseniana TaxID=2599607 RepID=A0AAP5BP79_9BURK|nr:MULTISPECIES: hypothetical protein [Paraburkholderia]MCX4151617.1 hypothetical protein [Paraburkholderia madseniana]MDN7154546.1 hypothetical protein [Paraburkholderia sp. WS6]MDQ6413429.1 hypothetical protein [Paraburkholderia madseniana]
MEKAAVLADSRLFLPVSPRDACVQEQAVLLLPTTQQQPTKNKQLPDSYYNYELLLQPPTATSTTNRYFNYQPLLQLPTTNYNNTHLLPVLQPIGTTVFTIRTTTATTNFSTPEETQRLTRCKGLTSRLFRCHRVVLRLRSNFTKVSQRIE